jgi:Transposase DDE domain
VVPTHTQVFPKIRMAKISENKLIARIRSLEIETIAQKTGYTKRKDQKIGLEVFIVGFMTSFMSKAYSLSGWATDISVRLKRTVTRQAIQGNFCERSVKAVQAVLEAALGQALNEGWQKEVRNIQKWQLFKAFRRVLIEDSTCQAVDSSLSSLFPTTNNGKGSISATLRIQAIYDLLNRCFVLLKLESYCDNDQKASRNILEIAQKDDLILRDRGYFVLDVLGEMIEKGIYFLSLWQPSVSILDATTKQKIDLASFLRKIGDNCVDMPILLGATNQLKIRLVALRLPQDIADRKRRIARENAKGQTNHSDAYYELLGWNLFVTNVPLAILSVIQISFAYRVRWRIETIFKCWKSLFNFKEFCSRTQLMPERVELSLYLILLLYTVRFDTVYDSFHEAVRDFHLTLDSKTAQQRDLSLLKAAELIRRYFTQLLYETDWKDYIPIFYQHATYAQRKYRADFESFTYNVF